CRSGSPSSLRTEPSAYGSRIPRVATGMSAVDAGAPGRRCCQLITQLLDVTGGRAPSLKPGLLNRVVHLARRPEPPEGSGAQVRPVLLEPLRATSSTSTGRLPRHVSHGLDETNHPM